MKSLENTLQKTKQEVSKIETSKPNKQEQIKPEKKELSGKYYDKSLFTNLVRHPVIISNLRGLITE